MKLFQKEKRFYFGSMSSNKNSLCWTLYGHDPAMLHLMGFIIPLFCFVGKCFLIYVVFKVYVCGTNPTVLWRSVIGLIHETVLALAICKYSVAVIFILEVSWSKIKQKITATGVCFTFCSFNLSGKGDPCNAQLQAPASWSATLLMWRDGNTG